MTSTAIVRPSADAKPHGYRAVWRWHFVAGLIIAPFLIVLTVTGAIYLFDREIEGWWNRDIRMVAVDGAPLSLAEQEARVAARFPGAAVTRVSLPRGPGEASVWNIAAREGPRNVYLDPYAGVVTGVVDPDLQPMVIVRKLHGTLLGGEFGSHVVELIACWTLVMMATGLWLWWPRRWRVRGVLVPRLAASGRRYWRDLHSIPSMIVAAFVILLVLTGLPWSAFWGPQFARLGDVVPFVAASPNFKAPPALAGAPTADPHAMHRAPPPDAKLPWAIQHTAAPHATGTGAATIADMEALLPQLRRNLWGEGVRIFYPRQPGDVFMVSYVPDKAEGQRTIYLDPGNARIVSNIGWADYSPVAKAVEWGVMVHMGRQYGLANQLANLIVCVALVGAIIAGIVLWWRRRPAGGIGVPLVHDGDRLPRPIAVVLAVMAVVFPLVGLTIVVVLVARKLRAIAAGT